MIEPGFKRQFLVGASPVFTRQNQAPSSPSQSGLMAFQSDEFGLAVSPVSMCKMQKDAHRSGLCSCRSCSKWNGFSTTLKICSSHPWPDCVGHNSAAFAQRLGRPNGRIDRRLVLNLCI